MHQLLNSSHFTQLLFSIPMNDYNPTTQNVTVYNFSLINSKTTSNFTQSPIGSPDFMPTTNFRRLNFLSPNTYYLNNELSSTGGMIIILIIYLIIYLFNFISYYMPCCNFSILFRE